MTLPVKISDVTVDVDLPGLLPSWLIDLQAERKSAQTLESYEIGVRQFLRWCQAEGVTPVLDRRTVNAWTAALLAGGAGPATARARLLAVRRFSAWLAAEDETDRDELIGIIPPKLDDKVVPRLTDEQCRDLIRACSGKAFVDRRDEGLVRFMLETAARAGEVLALELDDVAVVRGIATIRRGKGGKGRLVPFGPQTGRSLDRYLRARRSHPLVDRRAFWLGGGGQAFGYSALHKALGARAEAAGIAGFTPHVLRHTGAQRWLSAEGSEGGLMAVAGWARRDMLDRYTRATAAERAAEEARRLNLGDL